MDLDEDRSPRDPRDASPVGTATDLSETRIRPLVRSRSDEREPERGDRVVRGRTGDRPSRGRGEARPEERGPTGRALSLSNAGEMGVPPTRHIGLDEEDPYGELERVEDATRVPSGLVDWLRVGDEVIRLIKTEFLPFGAGNVVQSLIASGAESGARLNALRKMFFIGEDGSMLSVGDMQMSGLRDAETIVKCAISAAVVQGGNCLQHGEIAMALLNLLLPSGTKIALVTPSGLDHAFTVIGDLPDGRVAAARRKRLVCVDAWPHVAAVSLLSDSVFCEWSSATIVRQTATGGGDVETFRELVRVQRQRIEQLQYERATTRDGRHSRQSTLNGLAIADERRGPRQPSKTEQEATGNFTQLTAFEDDQLPNYDLGT